MTENVQDRRAARRAERELRVLPGDFARGRQQDHTTGSVTLDSTKVARGVTATWLAHVFDMQTSVVKNRLANCPVAARRGTQNIYELKVAAQYLVKPIVDMEEFMKNVRTDDLPVRFQEGYWAAKKKQLSYEQESGQLWRTGDVAAKFGEIFLLIRAVSKQWLDELADKTGITDAQRAYLETEIDRMHGLIRQKIRELPKRTRSELQRLNDELDRQRAGEAKESDVKAALKKGAKAEPDDGGEDDYSHLI